jgi:DedD protein
VKRRRGSRVGAVIAVIGLLGLIGGSFGLGMFVGLNWSYFATAMPWLVSRKSPSELRRTTDDWRRAEKPPKPADAAPSLTFYQELTAPLTSAPPRSTPPKSRETRPATRTETAGAGDTSARSEVASAPEKTSTSGDKTTRGDTTTTEDGRSARVATPAASASETSGDRGVFSVQLAAYKTRSQADALRETLAARGIAAYVSEASTPAGARYRVRVGPFDSKEAARQKAVVLAADTRLGAFVTNDASTR